MKIHAIFLLLAIAFLGSGLICPVYGQALSFSPTRVFFKGNPGETVTEMITIVNTGKDAYEFTGRVEDWKRDSLGQKIYAPMGSLAGSNAKSVRLDESIFKLAPGEKKSYAIHFTIPAVDSLRTTNSMLFLTQVNAREPEKKGKAGLGIKMSLELGIQLFYTPYGTNSGDLKFLSFEKQSSSEDGKKINRLAVKFENTGEINKDAFLRFELTNKSTGEEIKLKAIPVAIMPLDKQWAYGLMDETIAEGEYLAVAILDSGDKYNLKIAEKTIYVKK